MTSIDLIKNYIGWRDIRRKSTGPILSWIYPIIEYPKQAKSIIKIGKRMQMLINQNTFKVFGSNEISLAEKIRTFIWNFKRFIRRI